MTARVLAEGDRVTFTPPGEESPIAGTYLRQERRMGFDPFGGGLKAGAQILHVIADDGTHWQIRPSWLT